MFDSSGKVAGGVTVDFDASLYEGQLNQNAKTIVLPCTLFPGAEPPYPLSLSYGMSFFETGDMDTFMKEMDDNMYRMKAGHHACAETYPGGSGTDQ